MQHIEDCIIIPFYPDNDKLHVHDHLTKFS